MKKLIVSLFSLAVLSGCQQDDLYTNTLFTPTPPRETTEVEAEENPYSSGSGHSAGYEWAERTGGDCSGNSASFNEGCEEYYNQTNE